MKNPNALKLIFDYSEKSFAKNFLKLNLWWIYKKSFIHSLDLISIVNDTLELWILFSEDIFIGYNKRLL